jgi:recombination protein RecT
MALKTIKRMAYRDITIDSQKIDDNFLALVAQEQDAVRMIRAEVAQEEALENVGTGPVIDIPAQEIKDDPEQRDDKPAIPEQITIPIDTPPQQPPSKPERKKPQF